MPRNIPSKFSRRSLAAALLSWAALRSQSSSALFTPSAWTEEIEARLTIAYSKIIKIPRWKSQRIKIYRLDYKLSTHFYIASRFFFFWKSQRSGKSLETFGSRIFFLRFLKSILAGMDFPMDFWLYVINLFHQSFV